MFINKWKMKAITALPFEYKAKEYFALLRASHARSSGAYQVTILNGSLDKQLSGHDIINIDAAGRCIPVMPTEDDEVRELYACLGKAIVLQSSTSI